MLQSKLYSKFVFWHVSMNRLFAFAVIISSYSLLVASIILCVHVKNSFNFPLLSIDLFIYQYNPGQRNLEGVFIFKDVLFLFLYDAF